MCEVKFIEQRLRFPVFHPHSKSLQFCGKGRSSFRWHSPITPFVAVLKLVEQYFGVKWSVQLSFEWLSLPRLWPLQRYGYCLQILFPDNHLTVMEMITTISRRGIYTVNCEGEYRRGSFGSDWLSEPNYRPLSLISNTVDQQGIKRS